MSVIRIEYSRLTIPNTTLMIATPLVDLVPRGLADVTLEIANRLVNLVIDQGYPIGNISYEPDPTEWRLASSGSEQFEYSALSVVGQLRRSGLPDEYADEVSERLREKALLAYRFHYQTDPQFVNRERDRINSRVLEAVAEICSRRQSAREQLRDACGL